MVRGMTFDRVIMDVREDRFVLEMTRGTREDTFSDFTVRANKGSGEVWYDTYREYSDDGETKTETIYAHLDPDIAEQMGIALIQAAKIARDGYDPGQ